MDLLYIATYYFIVCELLENPDNGKVNCSLGDDMAASFEDTCIFSCNTGHELIGSDTRTCQSNGAWDGSVTVCRKGK